MTMAVVRRVVEVTPTGTAGGPGERTGGDLVKNSKRTVDAVIHLPMVVLEVGETGVHLLRDLEETGEKQSYLVHTSWG